MHAYCSWAVLFERWGTLSFSLVVVSMNILSGKYIDKADACFVRDCFVFEKFALLWTFLNIERCERDCRLFHEIEYM